MKRPQATLGFRFMFAVATAAVAGSGCAETREAPARTPAPTEAPPADRSSGSSSVASLFDKPRDDGLKTVDIHVGVGPSVQLGDFAKVHYVGKLEDGTEFDSSRRRGEAFDLVLGKGMVIKGFDRGMVGMKIGGVRKISIPWPLAYGERGSPPKIPPKANLVFEIELIDIPVPPPKAEPPKGQGPKQ